MKIVVLDGHTANPGDLSWKEMEKLGELTVYDKTPPELTVERARDAEAVLTNKVLLDAGVLAQLPKLKYIGVLATGYNVIDMKLATERGIVITNIPAYSTASVAQMVFAFILHFTNNVAEHSESVNRGDWSRSPYFSYWLSPQTELAGKTLGIIGFGQIGQAVARIALAFGMRVIYHNRSVKKTEPDAVQWDLDTVLRESDYLSINCPLNEDNAGFINKAAIEKMKPTAYLINTGRGPLVNEPELADALNQGLIAGAGLDVLSVEPARADNPLIGAKNCVITPHIAWATLEARARLIQIAVNNLRQFQLGDPVNVVN